MTEKEYLDPFEFLNKPRRIFMGLEMMAERNEEGYSPEEKALTLEIIEEAKKDFYAVTFPKFEARIDALQSK